MNEQLKKKKHIIRPEQFKEMHIIRPAPFKVYKNVKNSQQTQLSYPTRAF